MCPILFRGTPFQMDAYVLMTTLGFVAMGLLAHRRARQLQLDPRRVFRVFVCAAASGFVGARIGYVILHWEQYRPNPLMILRVLDGGMVWYTGLFLGTCGAIWAIRRVGLPLWKMLDLLAAPTAMMRVFGRSGCFLSGCCRGIPSALPWAVPFPPEGVPRHPTQLYESGGILAIFLILKGLERHGHPEGILPGVGFTLYALVRFELEWVRADAIPGPGGLSIGQWFSLALLAVGLWIVRNRLRVSHA